MIVGRRYDIARDGLSVGQLDKPFDEIGPALDWIVTERRKIKEGSARSLFALVVDGVHVAVRNGRLDPTGRRQRDACQRAGLTF